MNKTYLMTGGNKGDRFLNLEQATTNIELFCGAILQRSSLFETAAWGKTDQPAFLNQALLVETSLNPFVLMKTILEIELKLGRKRAEKYGPRIIDIDILFFNNEILDLPDLKIPHRELQNRRFVLVPMNEIAPAFVHPVFKKNIHELLAECSDNLDVKKIIA